MGLMVQHRIESFSSTDVMHYFGRKVNQNGSIPASFNGTLQIGLKNYLEGSRVKYRLNGNSTKFYDKAYSVHGSVLRGRVRGGARGYHFGEPHFASVSPRLSLCSDHLRTVLAVKGSLRRAQRRRALD